MEELLKWRIICLLIDFICNMLLMSAGFGLGYWIRILKEK